MQDLTPCREPSLVELQRLMRRVLTEPAGIHAALEKSPGLLPVIVDHAPLSPEDRLGVYANAYFLRLLECLETDYPATRRTLGRDDFVQLAADFLQDHPSTSPNVSDLGQSLPSFLRTHSLTQKLPFLPDLAQLEWAVLESIYSERLPPLDPSQLTSIPEKAWPKARLGLDPTVRILKSRWAIDSAWEKRREPPDETRLLLDIAERYLLVYRNDEAVHLKAIDAPQFRTLDELLHHASLEDACADLARRFPTAKDLNVMQWFKDWIQVGVIKQIRLEGE